MLSNLVNLNAVLDFNDYLLLLLLLLLLTKINIILMGSFLCNSLTINAEFFTLIKYINY